MNITDALVISKGYLAFSSIAFVTGAISKDEQRYILNHIEVTKRGLCTVFAATDGRRLHVAEMDPGLFDDDIETLDPGLYLLIAKTAKFIVIRKTEEINLKYPNWRSIMEPYEIGDNLAEVCTIGDSGKIGEVMIRTKRLLDTAFLASAIGYGTSRKAGELAHINFEARADEFGPVIIAHDHGTALVMPLRRTEHEDEGEGEGETYETAPITAFNEPEPTEEE